MKWREGLPFGKLLERWSNDGLFAEDAVLAHADVGQVTTDHALTHDDVLAIEDNVLRAAQNRLSADLVASMLQNNTTSIQLNLS